MMVTKVEALLARLDKAVMRLLKAGRSADAGRLNAAWVEWRVRDAFRRCALVTKGLKS